MSQFSPGDRVRLKSGGPVMTVESVVDGLVHCLWFDGKSPSQKVVGHGFPEAVLEKFDPGPSVLVV